MSTAGQGRARQGILDNSVSEKNAEFNNLSEINKSGSCLYFCQWNQLKTDSCARQIYLLFLRKISTQEDDAVLDFSVCFFVFTPKGSAKPRGDEGAKLKANAPMFLTRFSKAIHISIFLREGIRRLCWINRGTRRGV